MSLNILSLERQHKTSLRQTFLVLFNLRMVAFLLYAWIKNGRKPWAFEDVEQAVATALRNGILMQALMVGAEKIIKRE